MEITTAITLGVSLILFVVVLIVTESSLLASAAFAIPALLSLSLWMIQALTGVGPGNLIPHWIGASLLVGALGITLFWRWGASESSPKEEVQRKKEGHYRQFFLGGDAIRLRRPIKVKAGKDVVTLPVGSRGTILLVDRSLHGGHIPYTIDFGGMVVSYVPEFVVEEPDPRQPGPEKGEA